MVGGDGDTSATSVGNTNVAASLTTKLPTSLVVANVESASGAEMRTFNGHVPRVVGVSVNPIAPVPGL
jgi:hypothetical protein